MSQQEKKYRVSGTRGEVG